MMDEDSKQYTAFTVGNLGFFECERMPFGAMQCTSYLPKINAELLGRNSTSLIVWSTWMMWSSTQKMKNTLIGWEPYLRDSEEITSNWNHPNAITFQKVITYLAHDVSAEGIRPSKAGLKAVAEFLEPANYTQIRAFLGLVGHYHQFIKGFSKVA